MSVRGRPHRCRSCRRVTPAVRKLSCVAESQVGAGLPSHRLCALLFYPWCGRVCLMCLLCDTRVWTYSRQRGCGAVCAAVRRHLTKVPRTPAVVHFASPLTYLFVQVTGHVLCSTHVDNATHIPREDYLGCSCDRLACSGALYFKAEHRKGPVQDFQAAAAVVVRSSCDLRSRCCAALPDERCQAPRILSNKPRLWEELRSCVIRTMGSSLTSSAFSTVRLGLISQEKGVALPLNNSEIVHDSKCRHVSHVCGHRGSRRRPSANI